MESEKEVSSSREKGVGERQGVERNGREAGRRGGREMTKGT